MLGKTVHTRFAKAPVTGPGSFWTSRENRTAVDTLLPVFLEFKYKLGTKTMTDPELDDLFDEFLDAPELEQWASHLDGVEYEEARRQFRRVVKRALRTPEQSADIPGT